MLKKILIGVGILGALVLAAFILVAISASSRLEEAFKAKEPEFRQYVTMSVKDRNAYVEKNMTEIYKGFGINSEDAKYKEFLNKLETDPAAKAAGIEFGRSIIAKYILEAKSMADALNDENRVWLKADGDALEARSNRYGKMIRELDKN